MPSDKKEGLFKKITDYTEFRRRKPEVSKTPLKCPSSALSPVENKSKLHRYTKNSMDQEMGLMV